MNMIKDLVAAIKDNKTARTDLLGAIVDCSDIACKIKLPEPLKKVSTHHNFARPA